MDNIQIEALAMEMGEIIKTTGDFRQLVCRLEDITKQIVYTFKTVKCIYAGNSEKKSHFGCKKHTYKSHLPYERIIAAYNPILSKEKSTFQYYQINQMALSEKQNQVLVLFAKGITRYEMTILLETLYRSKIFSIPIPEVINAVHNSVSTWHQKTLNSFYSIVYFDFIRVQVMNDSYVIDKIIFFVLGINSKGRKEILGIWIASTEHDTSFWLTILTEIKNRGVKDIHIACVIPIKGVSGVLNRVYPKTRIQLRGKN